MRAASSFASYLSVLSELIYSCKPNIVLRLPTTILSEYKTVHKTKMYLKFLHRLLIVDFRAPIPESVIRYTSLMGYFRCVKLSDRPRAAGGSLSRAESFLVAIYIFFCLL